VGILFLFSLPQVFRKQVPPPGPLLTPPVCPKRDFFPPPGFLCRLFDPLALDRIHPSVFFCPPRLFSPFKTICFNEVKFFFRDLDGFSFSPFRTWVWVPRCPYTKLGGYGTSFSFMGDKNSLFFPPLWARSVSAVGPPAHFRPVKGGTVPPRIRPSAPLSGLLFLRRDYFFPRGVRFC